MKNYLRSMSSMQIGAMLALIMLTAFFFIAGLNDAAAGVIMASPLVATPIEALAEQFKTATSEVKALGDDLRGMQTELATKTSTGERVSTELKESVDKALTAFNGFKGQLTELEQKMSARGNGAPEREKSWGEQFIEGASYKGASDRGNRRGTISQEVKQVTSTAAGGLIRSYRETDVVNLMRERRVVRDLLRTVPVNTSSVDYAVQTTRTNAAAPVAEAAAKPYSDFAWDSETVVVRTLAHLAKITRQAMDDAPRLMGEIDSEMRYGLGYVEERQFLYGTGVGQNLHGIIPQATAYAKPVGYVDALGSRIDVLRLAMLQASLALLPADGIVLNELDWCLIELTKTTDGAYLFSNPQGAVSARMWGLPVVATPAMDADDFLVGNFQMGATVYDRMGVEVLISTENSDDFEKNLATVRAEERVAIAVKRPGAFITGTFAAAVADL